MCLVDSQRYELWCLSVNRQGASEPISRRVFDGLTYLCCTNWVCLSVVGGRIDEAFKSAKDEGLANEGTCPKKSLSTLLDLIGGAINHLKPNRKD